MFLPNIALAGDVLHAVSGVVRSASIAMYGSEPPLKHFNNVFFTVWIVLSTNPLL